MCTSWHTDRYIGSLFLVDEPVPMIRVVGQDEHSHEHLLYAEKVIVRNHILEVAHGGGRTQLSVQSAIVDDQLHHRVVAYMVAVIGILVTEANLERVIASALASILKFFSVEE